MRGALWILAVVTLLAGAAQAQTVGGYRVDGQRTCGGYARLPIGMATGMCAGLVYARPASGGIVMPRTVLPLPDGDVLVVAMGGWQAGRGAVWRLTPRPGREPVLRRLLANLDMPHLLAFGPDGRLYLGEMNRIAVFDPDAANPQATLQTVIGDLPSNQLHDDRHPLSMFLFDADGSLILNVGAPTDQCATPRPTRGSRCSEGVGPQAAAALWRYAYLGHGRWGERTLLASGLRNSMGLARSPSGAIFQAENSIDIADPDSPYDEVNRIRQGRHYGWPYCMDVSTPTPAWRGTGAMDCASSAHAPPAMLLAPHSAPLSLIYYDGPMFPLLQGQMLVSLHGYRGVGARIMAYVVDSDGAPVVRPHSNYATYRGANPVRVPFRFGPANTGLNLTPNWNAVRGVRPFGRPVGLSVARDGAIWVADDRNGTIIRIAADR